MKSILIKLCLTLIQKTSVLVVFFAQLLSWLFRLLLSPILYLHYRYKKYLRFKQTIKTIKSYENRNRYRRCDKSSCHTVRKPPFTGKY
nr:hypothetical protein IUWQDXFC_IUWQDXFC_CDS_0007 [Microvirus sp.]